LDLEGGIYEKGKKKGERRENGANTNPFLFMRGGRGGREKNLIRNSLPSRPGEKEGKKKRKKKRKRREKDRFKA